MVRTCLWFEGQQRVSVREEPLDAPRAGEVLVEAELSAISSGTEMLFYRGDLEAGIEVDTTLEGHRRPLVYPLPYGYSTVGRVVATGEGVDEEVGGKLVYLYLPHASAFRLPRERAVVVPSGIASEDAVFLGAAETAVSFLLDAAPLIGERVSLFGLGIIGLLTAALLARFPLGSLHGYELHDRRRQAASLLGVTARDPRELPPAPATEDLALELSGSAEAFRLALACCAFSGRVILGSWYGSRQRRMPMEAFDTAFHRNRVRIVSSQVSSIDPALRARWDGERRLATAWEAIRTVRPSRWISHRIPFARAADAYQLIGGHQDEVLQVLLVHGGAGGGPPRR